MRHLTRRQSLMLAGGAVALTGVLPTRGALADKHAVRVGEIGLSFHQVASAVTIRVLERLGHTVEVSAGPHDRMFESLGAGTVDILAVAWLPGAHGHLLTAAGTSVRRLGAMYRDAKLYWAVPEHVPIDAVASIADLAKPEVAARMDKRIRSIGPSAGLSVRSARALELYGLSAAGYALETGDAAGWIANFRAAVGDKRWMVMPLWQPQFLNVTDRYRILDDPEGAFPPADEAVLVASTAALDRLPARTVAILERIDVGLDGIAEMDRMVNIDKRTPREAAAAWIAANPARVERWFA